MINDRQYQAIQRERLRPHFDANETVFLERELTQLRAKIIEMRFPELKARSLMPMATDIAASANTYAYKVLRPKGKGKIVANGTNDLPRVDLEADERVGKVYPIGYSYAFDINELREAARLQVPLSELKARVTRDQCERDIDEVLAFGDFAKSGGQSTGGVTNGLINNPDVVAQGVASGTVYVSGTTDPKVALGELNGLVSTVRTESLQIFNVNTVLLPQSQYDFVSQTPYSDMSPQSVLKVFLENNPGVKAVMPWHRLDTAGAANAPRGVAYELDPSVLEGVVPQEFEQLPPEARGTELIINCLARCGGVKIYQPRGFKYIDFAPA